MEIQGSTAPVTGANRGIGAVLEAIITVKALEGQVVPPAINIETLDPECDLDLTPGTAGSCSLRAAMSDSFGFGGTNATLVFKAA